MLHSETTEEYKTNNEFTKQVADLLNRFSDANIYSPSIYGIRVNLIGGGYEIDMETAIKRLNLRIQSVNASMERAKEVIRYYREKQVSLALEALSEVPIESPV